MWFHLSWLTDKSFVCSRWAFCSFEPGNWEWNKIFSLKKKKKVLCGLYLQEKKKEPSQLTNTMLRGSPKIFCSSVRHRSWFSLHVPACHALKLNKGFPQPISEVHGTSSRRVNCCLSAESKAKSWAQMTGNAAGLISGYIIPEQLDRLRLHRPHPVCHNAAHLRLSIKPLWT